MRSKCPQGAYSTAPLLLQYYLQEVFIVHSGNRLSNNDLPDYIKTLTMVGTVVGTQHNERHIKSVISNLTICLYYGTPSVTRTRDLRIRNPTLYPPELWGHTVCKDTSVNG